MNQELNRVHMCPHFREQTPDHVTVMVTLTHLASHYNNWLTDASKADVAIADAYFPQC